MAPLRIRHAIADDLPFITTLLNHAVAHSTCIWAEEPYTVTERQAWFAGRDRRHVVLVADRDGDPLGWAGLGSFRAKSGYRHSAEHSVYVAGHAQRQGVGRALMQELIAQARAAGLHALIGGISADQEPSLALHRALGFAEVGRLPEVGIKHGRWLDLVFMQLLLKP